MRRLLLFFVVSVTLIGLSAALVACTGSGSEPGDGLKEATQTPASTPPGEATGGSGAAGSRLAPGLYELAGGTSQAVGVLEYRDLEGGMWVIVGGTEAEGNAGEVVAVIANPEQFQRTLTGMRNQLVAATGRKAEGASIRMAGPEIVISGIEAIKDTGGPAD